MAMVKVAITGELTDGMTVKFKAPCDCSEVSGLRLSRLTYNGSEYVESNTDFTLRDASGQNIAGIGNLFVEGAVIKAVLDTDNRYAYLLNAGTTYRVENSVQLVSDKVTLVSSADLQPGTVRAWHDTVRKSVCVEFMCEARGGISSGTEIKLATLDASISPTFMTPGCAFCENKGAMSIIASGNEIRGRAIANIPEITNIIVQVEYFITDGNGGVSGGLGGSEGGTLTPGGM